MNMMNQWEYAQIEVSLTTLKVQVVTEAGGKWGGGTWEPELHARIVEAKEDDDSLTSVLAVLGKYGWELVASLIQTPDGQVARLILKRPAR
jgi:hypothetical protein